MLRSFDRLLNAITMYRLLMYGLLVLTLISLVLSVTGSLSLPITGMLLSLGLLSAAGYITNTILGKIWNVPTNLESGLITTLILFCILPQADSLSRAAYIFLAGVLAMASKFLIVRHNAHIFNPAAFAASILGITGLLHASWWIGSSVLWPFTLLFGLLVVRKIRRWPLVASFAVVSIVTSAVLTLLHHQNLGSALSLALTASPLIFLGTVMLTEPSTMPSRRIDQVIFAAIVGLFYSAQLNLGGFFVYPEVALLLGNLYAFFISPKYHVRLQLKTITKISDQVYDYIFTPDKRLAFAAGQYMEWTMPGQTIRRTDGRGNRRTFTIASSPTEPDVHLGVKFYNPASTYKRFLHGLQPGASLFAGQVAGDFVLPSDQTARLVFIAGGIGITPFRSMLKYVIDTQEQRDIVLFYLVSSPDEVAYEDVLQQASQHGVTVIKVLSHTEPSIVWTGLVGRFDQTMLAAQVPDFTNRRFYVSGSPDLVRNTKQALRTAKVPRRHIHADYFSGY